LSVLRVHRFPRTTVFFILAVLCQVSFLKFAVAARGEDLWSVLMPAVFIAPMVLLVLAVYPYETALFIPLLVIIPGATMGFTVAEYFLLGVLFFSLLRAFAVASPGESPRWMDGVFLLYVIWAFLSLHQVLDLRDGLEGLRRIVLFLLAFVVGDRIIGSSRAPRFLRIMSFLPLLVAGELAFVIITSGYPLTALLTRVGALTNLGWGYSNYVAAVATLPVACAIPLALYGSARERLLGLSAILASALVSIATVSRGGTMVLALALVITLLLEARRRSLFPLILVGSIGAIYALSPFGQANLARFIQPSDLPSVEIRILFFTETFRVFREHWLWGIGPDQIAYHTASFIERNPHNIFLKNAVEFGVIGLFLYVLLLATCLRTAAVLRKYMPTNEHRMIGLAFLLLLIMAVTNAMFEPTLEGSQFGIPFWLSVGAFTAWARSQKQSASIGT